MAAHDTPSNPRGRLGAIALMCGAVLCFSCLDASAKWLGRFFDPVLITWARYAVNVALVAAVLNPLTTPRLLRSNRPAWQAARSLLLVVSTMCNFVALQYLQLTETLAIQFAMPLIVAALAGPMLGEWAGPRQLAAVAVGFVGVLVITRPGLDALHPAMLLSLANTVFYALYAILTRMLAAHDPASTTIFYSGLAGTLLLLPLVPFVWRTPATALEWTLMLGMGFFAAVGHALLTVAHARAPASVLSPFVYTQIVWMAALGFFVFGDVPDGWTAIGAAIVIASGLYLMIRERG